MGFSVSGSFAVIAIATFVAFGMFYGVASNTVERVTDAQRAAFDDRLDQQNTEINVTNATWSGSTLTVEVNNTGTTPLSVNATDLVVDNDYVGHDEATDEFVVTASGKNDRDTDLWVPGETLHVEIPGSALDATPPSRVKVVVEGGVAGATEVS